MIFYEMMNLQRKRYFVDFVNSREFMYPDT